MKILRFDIFIILELLSFQISFTYFFIQTARPFCAGLYSGILFYSIHVLIISNLVYLNDFSYSPLNHVMKI